MNRLSRLIATTLYTGYCPIAPGTVGGLVGLFLWYTIPGLREYWLLCLTLILFIAGVWAAGQVEKTEGHDARVINMDEFVGMWVALLFFPDKPFYIGIIAFILFRLFDIIKPYPANISEKLPNGWGVMTDDVLAGVYANISLRLLMLIF